jgi:HIRAN domain
MSASARLRIWLERAGDGFRLRNAATEELLREEDPRIRVVRVAGASYRLDALQDDAFAPGRRLALVSEPDNEHDPHAIGIWDEGRRLQAGYVPADSTGRVPPDAQALSLWEFRDGERRVGLRVLIAPADAWIGLPRLSSGA